MTELEQFNQFLKDRGGITVEGKVRYRLVWSDDMWEFRFGHFRDYDSSGKLFLREVREHRKAPKYTHIRERWIVEKFITEAQGEYSDGYEPLYVYESGDGQFLPPTMKSLEFLLWAMQNPARIKNASDRKADYDKNQENLIEKAIEMMEFDEATVAYRLGERVSMTGTNKEEKGLIQ